MKTNNKNASQNPNPRADRKQTKKDETTQEMQDGNDVYDDELIDSDVSEEERKTLEDAAEHTPDVEDDISLEAARLDDRDEDGELLNEGTGLSGRDLDVPGSEEDDENEDIGAEDEENNSYSLGGEQEDDSISRE